MTGPRASGRADLLCCRRGLAFALRVRCRRDARRLPRAAQARASRRSADLLPIARAEPRSLSARRRRSGAWDSYDDANSEFRAAVAQADRNALYRVRWGRLMHERFNNTDADALFKEALERDPKNAQAYLGLALVSADGFDEKAVEWATKAIELDPKLVEAHELMANLALEDSNSKNGRRGGRRSDQAFRRRARRDGDPRRPRTSRRPLAGCVAR